MKLILLKGTAVAALTMAASGDGYAPSNPTEYYIAADLGYNWKSDQKLTSVGQYDRAVGRRAVSRFNLSTPMTMAPSSSVASATRFSQKWRVELEGAYRPGDIDRKVGRPADGSSPSTKRARPWAIRTAPSASTAPGNTVLQTLAAISNQTSLMANVIHTTSRSDYRFHPYLGLGIGVVTRPIPAR